MENNSKTSFTLGLSLGAILVVAIISGAVMGRIGLLPFIDKLVPGKNVNLQTAGSATGTKQIVDEESVVTKVVSEATPSVVTVSMTKQNQAFDPTNGKFDFFGQFFNQPSPTPQTPGETTQDIGTGFVIAADGLIVTNKHVVADTTAKYQVTIGSDTESVVNIYRDPITDLAILKINKTGLTPLPLGDSDHLKVGQTVIAIGTALGEFRSTVTTGVISGLSRGITAGSFLEGSEKLDNVIQTDAAINPGNSGGPLIDSSGNVIGVNVAVSQSGQNIGFALPINIIKSSIDNFKTTGEFDRPYLGVSYQMISRQAALLNEVPAGAYVQSVLANSPAEKAGLKQGDIITEIDGNKLGDNATFSIANYINQKKIGDSVTLKYYRDNKADSLTIKLEKKAQ